MIPEVLWCEDLEAEVEDSIDVGDNSVAKEATQMNGSYAKVNNVQQEGHVY